MLRWLLPLLLLAPLSASAQDAHKSHSDVKRQAANTRTSPEYSRFTSEMNVAMSAMMKDMHAPGYVGDPDIDFLAMMIAHHEGAVEMARLVLVHGRDPATRRLADEIIASQSVEIESMKRRLAALRSGKRPSAESFPELGGTRGPVR